jgi:ABC-type transport system substrate-binding protein
MTSEEGKKKLDRRSFLVRGAAGGTALVLGGVALEACSSGSSSSSSTGGAAPSTAGVGVGKGSPVKGGSLIFGTNSEIDGFYPPSNHWDKTGYLYARAVYDPLVAIAADGSWQPYLAESVTPNATFDVWTLKLRPNVKFNDGSDLTSAVLLANIAALKASALTNVPLELVSSTKAIDNLTVQFNLSQASSTFPIDLTSQVGYVVGQAMIDNNGKGNPVGTGPFIYQSWEPNSHFICTRNPNYWQTGYPYLDQITFRPIPDDGAREASLMSGGVDIIMSANATTVEHFQNNSNYQLVDSSTGVIGEPTIGFIGLNVAKGPTANPDLRLAMAKGFNQAQIQKIFGGGFTKPINGLFLKGSPYYSDTGFPTYDPEGARQLVAKYKAAHGAPKVTLTTISTPQLSQISQVLQQMWSEVGITITIQFLQQASLIDNLVLGEFEAITANQFGAVDPDLNYVWLSSTTVAPPGQIGLNFMRNSDPVIQQALTTGRESNDPAVRQQAYKTVNERLAKDLPYLWTGQTLYSVVSNNRTQNFNALKLPTGKAGYAFDEGDIFLHQIWLNS